MGVSGTCLGIFSYFNCPVKNAGIMGFMRTSAIVLVTAILVSVLPGYLKPKLKTNIRGSVSPGWEKVEKEFRSQVESGEQQGGGFADPEAQIPWTEDTISQFFSTTKGISALVIAMLVDRGLLDYKKPVKDYWPEFAANGKEKITVEQLFSHQAGLYGLDVDVSYNDIKKHSPKYTEALANQKPLWPPGTKAGYHSVTIGLYQDLVVRKVDPKHRSLSQFFKEELADPLGLDFYIGLPLEQNWRCARKLDQGFLDFVHEVITHPSLIPLIASHIKYYVTPGQFAMKALIPADLLQSFNNPMLRDTPIPSVFGFGKADSVAKLYGIIANGGKYKGKQYMSPEIITKLTESLYEGPDVLLAGMLVNYGRGFFLMPNKKNDSMTIGTPGAGGQMGYGDIKNKLGWGYQSNLHRSGIVSELYLALWDAMYDSLELVQN